ncbi:hypothetical protein JCM13664_19560 [Methylothermus subterraneus]|nr:hypothetical protein HGMM_F15F08C24 [uncultured Gammaproteobacteria bacterium]
MGRFKERAGFGAVNAGALSWLRLTTGGLGTGLDGGEEAHAVKSKDANMAGKRASSGMTHLLLGISA